MKHRNIRKGQHYILAGTHLLHGAQYSNLRVTVLYVGEHRILVRCSGLEKWVNPKELSRE